MRGLISKSGFTLLEVMVALAILVSSLVLLMEVQSSSIAVTREAERILTATNLATEKLTEVVLLVETEGFSTDDVEESGDFSEFGDEGIDLEFGDQFDDYHWEYSVAEVEIELSADLAGMADSLGSSGYFGEPNEEIDQPDDNSPGLDSLGVSGEMITEMLAPFIREIRVRIWWGDSSRNAEENGNEIILTTHVVNTSAEVIPGANAAGASQSPQSTPTAPTSTLQSVPGGAGTTSLTR